MLKVRDIMSSDVVTLDPELSLREAAETLVQRHIGGAAVVAGHRVVGVVSATDVLSFAASAPGVPTERPTMAEDAWEPIAEWQEGEEPPAAYFSEWWEDAGLEATERFATVEGPEWDVLADRVVGDVMTSTICSVLPDASVAEAARVMIRAAVHRLLVLDAHAMLMGIVTPMDVVRAVSNGWLVDKPLRRGTAPHAQTHAH